MMIISYLLTLIIITYVAWITVGVWIFPDDEFKLPRPHKNEITFSEPIVETEFVEHTGGYRDAPVQPKIYRLVITINGKTWRAWKR